MPGLAKTDMPGIRVVASTCSEISKTSLVSFAQAPGELDAHTGAYPTAGVSQCLR